MSPNSIMSEWVETNRSGDYAYRTYIKPAHDGGQEIVRIRCGDVHKALGFVNRNSMVLYGTRHQGISA